MLWVVRAGDTPEHERRALDEGRVYAAWHTSSQDISTLRSQDELRDVLSGGHPNWNQARAVNAARQLWQFTHEIEPSDWIVVPLDRGKAFHIGEVTGRYAYDETAEGPYRHSLVLNWVGTAVPRAKFDVDLRHIFGGFMKVFRAHRNDAEARLRAMAVADGWRSAARETDPPDLDYIEGERAAAFFRRRLKQAWIVASAPDRD